MAMSLIFSINLRCQKMFLFMENQNNCPVTLLVREKCRERSAFRYGWSGAKGTAT